MASESPTHVGPYDILGVVGKGGMGVVYKGFQNSLNRIVAIKLLPPEFQSDPERVERFHREAQAIAILSHPNIVQIIDKGAEGKTLYFVMEYVDGVSLDTLLRERRLTLIESLHVAKEIAKGLAAAHACQIIHRDLKPRNVLVSRDLSMVKLVDFGISRVEMLSQASGAPGALTSAHTSMGTMYYFAPEQARDPSSVDQRSDLYSLGVICYEMLTGQVPVGQFQLPSEVNPELSSQVDALLLKCLATDRAKRYASAKDFLADVDKLEKAAGFKLLSELKSVSKTTSRLIHSGAHHATSKRNALIAAAIAAIVLVGGYLAWPLMVRPNDTASTFTSPAAAPSDVPSSPVTSTPAPVPASEPSAPAPSAVPPPEAATPSPAAVPPAAGPGVAKAAPSSRADAKSRPATPAPAPAPAASVPEPPPPTPEPVNTAATEIEQLRHMVASRRYDEAATELRNFLSKYPQDPHALDAYIMMADLHEKQGRPSDAVPAYLDVAARYPKDPRAAGALYRAAQLMMQSRGQELEVRKTLGELVSRYPTGLWTVGALTMKAAIEERLKLRERDSVLVATVPASLPTYRTLVESYPSHAAAQPAFVKLADMYDDLKRYDLAARAFADLGTNFPNNRFDAWFKAGELYERRVNDRAAALRAYQRVPQDSDNFREAQKRVTRLMQ